MSFCVESACPRRAVYFSGLDAKFRREFTSGENFGPIGAQCATRAGNLRQFCVKVWRADSDAISVRILIPEIFLNLRSVPLGVVGCFLCILLYRFLQRRPSIEMTASSFVRFSENSFCREPIRAGILRRVVAVVLSVSLLATMTPVLRRSHCVGHATARPREHRLATDAFSISFLTRFP